MNSDKLKIFVVDDDPMSRMIIVDQLDTGKYDVVEFDNGAQCIDSISQNPDIVVLDVEMPLLNGYSTCRKIKDYPLTKDTQVIFVSSHDTTEEKLEGYAAGGSDYLIKPIQPEELTKKIEIAAQHLAARAQQSTELTQAVQTAMTAISNAGEQGTVLGFMRESFSMKTVGDLAELIVQSFLGLGVETTVQIRASTGIVNRSSRMPIAPLEEELLTRLKDAGRIQEVGSRLISNFGAISLLIKNLPDDADKRGRLRDHLALLLEGAESKLHSLEMELGVSRTLKATQSSLARIETMQITQKSRAMEIIDGTMADLEESFMTCGLTEEQEEMLMKIVQSGVDESLENFEKGMQIEEEMTKIVSSLRSLAG